MTAITKANIVQRIRYELGDRPWEDSSLSAASGSSTITGATTGFWVKGDIGEFADDGDTWLTISETGGTITATRSYWGSTGVAHTAIRGYKNPRYGYTEILNAIEATIQGKLPFPRIYKLVADTITPDVSDATPTTWYDLAAAAVDLIDVRQLYGTNDTKQGFFGLRHSGKPVELRRNMTSTLVASGVGVRFPGGFYHPTNTVNVDYAAKITDAGTTSYTDLNEGDAVTEAVIYATCAHLEAALENRKPRRPRQDRETLRGASVYENLYQEAIHRAEQELLATIPRMTKLSKGS